MNNSRRRSKELRVKRMVMHEYIKHHIIGGKRSELQVLKMEQADKLITKPRPLQAILTFPGILTGSFQASERAGAKRPPGRCTICSSSQYTKQFAVPSSGRDRC